MVLEAFGQALANYANWGTWLWLLLGVVWALIFGIIPGISGPTGMAIFLGLAFGLQPLQALLVMVALASVAVMGGSITAVLLGIPGDAPNVVTTFDGFPMTQRGEGGRALGAALTASMLAGAAPVFLSIGLVFAILPMVMAVTSMDMVFVILIGLAFIVVLGRGSMLKGLISGGVGLLIASIGLAIVTAEPRATFGMPFLYDGLHLGPVFLGLFGIPPMVELAAKGGGGTLARGPIATVGFRDLWQGARDVFHHWRVSLYSSAVGYVFGIVPGIGSIGATFVSYGYAKRSSKHPEKFGTGVVEGVIAPESCNSACKPGDLLVTLALGIPGSASMALLLGAMIMLGLVPGPGMLTQRLDISLTLIIAVAAANMLAAAICFPLALRMAGIARIPGRVLVPVVVSLCFVGAFASGGQFQDLIVLVIFGIIGTGIKHFGYNSAALVLGFILGDLFERYLWIGLRAAGPLFFLRPISLFLVVVLIAIFAYSPLKRLVERRSRARA